MIRPALSLVLLAFAAAALSGRSDTIVIGTVGRAHPDVMRGIEFGEHEMARTAQLLGRDLRVATPDPAAGAAALTRTMNGWIVASGDSPSRDVPAIHLGRLPPSAGNCEFAMGLNAPAGDEVLWHPSLGRFGASELNERFVRRYDLPMTADAWAGWVAVKALVESTLRRRPDERACEALGRLRFDGHKGRPLFFDPSTRRLSQPVYVVKGGRVVGERE